MQNIMYGLGIAAVLIGLSVAILRPKWRRARDEKVISGSLAGLPKESYKVIRNVRLGTDAKAAWADYVVISEYGVFLITSGESKVRPSDMAEAAARLWGVPLRYIVPLRIEPSGKPKQTEKSIYPIELRNAILSYGERRIRRSQVRVLVDIAEHPKYPVEGYYSVKAKEIRKERRRAGTESFSERAGAFHTTTGFSKESSGDRQTGEMTGFAGMAEDYTGRPFSEELAAYSFNYNKDGNSVEHEGLNNYAAKS